jgi:hypothetical protein
MPLHVMAVSKMRHGPSSSHRVPSTIPCMPLPNVLRQSKAKCKYLVDRVDEINKLIDKCKYSFPGRIETQTFPDWACCRG